jgi:antitoxin ParD1/3/4
VSADPSLKYLAGYPPDLLDQVRALMAEGRLAERLERRYPERHAVSSDGALYDYVNGLKTRYVRNAGPLSKVVYDSRLLMSRQTMSFALPESMREYIDNRVAAGNYGNTSEYIRDLVRRDQEEQAKKRLRDLIEEGLASGPGRRRTKADEKELLAIARGEID